MKLILFDIDGTLVNSSRIGRKALGQALLHVFGTIGALETFEFAGKTDRRIVRDLMAGEGWSDSGIDDRLSDLDDHMAAAGRDLFTSETVWACLGIPALLEELGRREDVVPALLTGNIRHTAVLKLTAAGIDPGQFVGGAFGSDSLERDDLFDIALERVHQTTGRRFDRSQTVIVGDTPDDIRCARNGGGRAIAVATGPYPAELLDRHQPDYLFPNLAQTDDVLRAILEPITTPFALGR